LRPSIKSIRALSGFDLGELLEDDHPLGFSKAGDRGTLGPRWRVASRWKADSHPRSAMSILLSSFADSVCSIQAFTGSGCLPGLLLHARNNYLSAGLKRRSGRQYRPCDIAALVL
jgi:hypothetical protein